ncbi:hypothetical protein ACRWW7_25040 [Escherichia coli]
MTQNQGSEPVPASRTGQLISARDMAMQKFEEGMRLISEASELCGLSLFTSRIMQPNAFGLPSLSTPRCLTVICHFHAR